MSLLLSVRDQLAGKTILLTGGLGGVGSTCLEQLLRQTEVKAVLLLARRRGSRTALERVRKMLCGPLFHELHEQAPAGDGSSSSNPFSKVRVVEGDLDLPGLGLSPADRKLVLAETDMVLHSAADLSLEAHIQRTLRANYCGTARMLQLAAGMPRLRAFVFVSTYYVSNFKPYNSLVREEVHQLTLQLTGDPTVLTHAQLVELLLSLPPEAAASEAAALMNRLNFASTYAFGKLLTELLVDDAASLPEVAKVIVRPSLVSNLAGAPYPGHCTGFAGAPGYSLSYGAGFYHSIEGVAYSSDAVIDLIPADTVSALIIAAAATAAAHGPYPADTAKVYHAASSASHPCLVTTVFSTLHSYWSTNPCPAQLPFARHPTFAGRHTPQVKSLQRHHQVVSMKVWLARQLLKLSGRSKQAAVLHNGFKAFAVQNKPGLNRSFICQVDNARELQASLVPEEAGSWCCVWDKDTSPDWETYITTSLTGLYNQAFKKAPPCVTGALAAAAARFVKRDGLAEPSVMERWMAAGTDSSKPSMAVTQLVGKGAGEVAGGGGGGGAAAAACASTVSVVAACVSSSSEDDTSEEGVKP